MEKWITTKDTTGRSLWIVPVCNPSGVIKYVRVSPYITSGIVSAASEQEQGGRVVMSLRTGLAEKGWAFMSDLFMEDNGAKAWNAFRGWMEQTHMVGAESAVKPFPVKYLPSGVTDRRAGVAQHQGEPDEISIPELDDRPAHTSKAKRRAAGFESAGV